MSVWLMRALLAQYIIFMHSSFVEELQTATVSRMQIAADIVALQERLTRSESRLVQLEASPVQASVSVVKKRWWQ